MTTLDTRPTANPQVIDSACTPNPNPHRVSVLASTTCVFIGVSGLVTTALTTPDLVLWPVGATLAASVAAAVCAWRHDVWQVPR